MSTSPFIGVAVATVLCTAPAAGQTRFTWPDTAVDLATYTTPEACRAAVDRTRQGVEDREALAMGVWLDTLGVDPGERRSTPPAVVEAARTCLTRFAGADTVPLEDYQSLVPLYLTAGWTDRTRVLVDRRLAEVDPDDDQALEAVIDTVVGLFGLYDSGNRMPWTELEPRVALLDDVLATHLRNGADQLRVYLKQWQRVSLEAFMNESMVDTVSARRLATRITAIAESLSPDEREAVWQELASGGLLQIDEPGELSERLAGSFDYVLNWPVFLDSLRQSTAAYVEVVRAARERATGRPPEAFFRGRSIGERAPILEGDVWLRCEDPCDPRPRPGRVSLVIFLRHDRCAIGFPNTDERMYRNCANPLTTVRRLMDRFPDLEVTVVTATRGHFYYVKEKESITPEREAELTRRWLDSFGLQRAVLAMTETDYWRLPSHDGRRIDPDVANYTNYTFGGSTRLSQYGPEGFHSVAFLVDQDGIIVHDWFIRNGNESEFADRIEILFERGRAQ